MKHTLQSNFGCYIIAKFFLFLTTHRRKPTVFYCIEKMNMQRLNLPPSDDQILSSFMLYNCVLFKKKNKYKKASLFFAFLKRCSENFSSTIFCDYFIPTHPVRPCDESPLPYYVIYFSVESRPPTTIRDAFNHQRGVRVCVKFVIVFLTAIGQ